MVVFHINNQVRFVSEDVFMAQAKNVLSPISIYSFISKTAFMFHFYFFNDSYRNDILGDDWFGLVFIWFSESESSCNVFTIYFKPKFMK